MAVELLITVSVQETLRPVSLGIASALRQFCEMSLVQLRLIAAHMVTSTAYEQTIYD